MSLSQCSCPSLYNLPTEFFFFPHVFGLGLAVCVSSSGFSLLNPFSVFVVFVVVTVQYFKECDSVLWR